MKKNSRKCPYCESKVSYIKALTEVSVGEHTCPECYKKFVIIIYISTYNFVVW